MLSKSSVEAIRPKISITPAATAGEASSLLRHAKPIVFVVDDDTAEREALEVLIGDAGWHFETFESAIELLSRPRSLGPSCLVLDITRAGSDGLDMQKRFAAERPDMPVIFITRDGDVSTAVQAMKAGAVEFLTKPFNDAALLNAVQHAIERSASALSLDTEMQELRASYASLSRREQQVMTLVVSGLLNKQVGFELGISEITVKAHRGRVMRKMNAGSFADLVKIAAKLCLGVSSDEPPKPRRTNRWLRDEGNAVVVGGYAS
jgi:FixJ family two-component response regulator